MTTIFRLTTKKLPMIPVPFGYPMYGILQKQKWVYRIRKNGEVCQSGVTSFENHGEIMLTKKITNALKTSLE